MIQESLTEYATMADAAEMEFNEDLHLYTWRGEVIPSVTQILKEFGFIDDQWYTEEAKIRGRAVHKACELWDKGTLNPNSLHASLEGYLEAWKRFTVETGFESELIEHRVVNPIYRYAGTLDRVGVMHKVAGGPRKTLLDIKSGVAQRWAALQVGGYEACFLKKDYHRMVVELRKDGTYRTPDAAIMRPSDKGIFCGLASAWHWKRSK